MAAEQDLFVISVKDTEGEEKSPGTRLAATIIPWDSIARRTMY